MRSTPRKQREVVKPRRVFKPGEAQKAMDTGTTEKRKIRPKSLGVWR